MPTDLFLPVQNGRVQAISVVEMLGFISFCNSSSTPSCFTACLMCHYKILACQCGVTWIAGLDPSPTGSTLLCQIVYLPDRVWLQATVFIYFRTSFYSMFTTIRHQTPNLSAALGCSCLVAFQLLFLPSVVFDCQTGGNWNEHHSSRSYPLHFVSLICPRLVQWYLGS